MLSYKKAKEVTVWKSFLKNKHKNILTALIPIQEKSFTRLLNDFRRLDGNIVRLEGSKNRYRFKIDHYRILFEREKGVAIITVIEINTRSNIKY